MSIPPFYAKSYYPRQPRMLPGRPAAPVSRPIYRRKRYDGPVTTATVRKMISNAITNAAEEKFLYVSNNATSFTASGLLVNLSTIVQGDGDDQRVGDQVRLQSLLFNIRCVPNTAPEVFRVIIWRYTPLNTVTPSVSFPIVSATGVDYLTAMSPIDPKNKQTCIVLRDYMVTQGASGSDTHIRGKRFLIDLKNVEQVYTGDLSTNQIYVSFFAEGVPIVALAYYSQLRYTDS